jgi:hypothetical protein
MSRPIVSSFYDRGNHRSCICRTETRQTEQHDTATGRQTKSPSKFAEILVKSKQNPPVDQAAFEDVLIGNARSVSSDPGHIVARRTQHHHRITKKVFVRKESHRQAIAAGYTFSDCNISLAYCRQAEMSSWVMPG